MIRCEQKGDDSMSVTNAAFGCYHGSCWIHFGVCLVVKCWPAERITAVVESLDVDDAKVGAARVDTLHKIGELEPVDGCVGWRRIHACW